MQFRYTILGSLMLATFAMAVLSISAPSVVSDLSAQAQETPTVTATLPVSATLIPTATSTDVDTATSTVVPTATVTPKPLLDAVFLPILLCPCQIADDPTRTPEPVDPGGFWETIILPGSGVKAGKGDAIIYMLDDTEYLPDGVMPLPSAPMPPHRCRTMVTRSRGPYYPLGDWMNEPTPDPAILNIGTQLPQTNPPLNPPVNPATPAWDGLYGWQQVPPDRCYVIELVPAPNTGQPQVVKYLSPVFGVVGGLDVTDMDYCQDGWLSGPGWILGGPGTGIWGSVGAGMACRGTPPTPTPEQPTPHDA